MTPVNYKGKLTTVILAPVQERCFGTASSAFVAASLQQLIAAARLPGSGISETAVNATLAFIEGAKPQGEVECGLVMQMACTHSAAMSVLGTFAGANGYGRDVPFEGIRSSKIDARLRSSSRNATPSEEWWLASCPR